MKLKIDNQKQMSPELLQHALEDFYPSPASELMLVPSHKHLRDLVPPVERPGTELACTTDVLLPDGQRLRLFGVAAGPYSFIVKRSS